MFQEELVQLLSLAGVHEDEEIEIVRYGLQHLFYNVLGMGTILLSGSAFGMFIEAVVMALSIFPLRKYAGGFHADSPRRCYMLSSAIVLLGFVIAKTSFPYVSAYTALSICAAFIILIFAPVECKNKRLDDLEKVEYKRKTRQIMCVEAAVVCTSYIIQSKEIIMGIVMSWWIVAIAVIVVLFKLKD